MLNFSCKKQNIHRKGSRNLEGSNIRVQDYVFEARRCLRTMSCEACDLCRLLCPDLAITRDASTGHINIDLDYCKGCGICAYICPKGAISMVMEENM
ncbi:4Fe-4S binding protein [Thermodesulfobacteriota bacterium]